MATSEKGILRIPEQAIHFFEEETKYEDKVNTNPVAFIPWGREKKNWPMAMTQGLVNRNNQPVNFGRIAYSEIAKTRIQQGFISEHIVLDDPNFDIGYTIPIEWVEIIE